MVQSWLGLCRMLLQKVSISHLSDEGHQPGHVPRSAVGQLLLAGYLNGWLTAAQERTDRMGQGTRQTVTQRRGNGHGARGVPRGSCGQCSPEPAPYHWD